MSDTRVFTDFVEALEPDTTTIPRQVIVKLRKLLRSKLKRRGLLDVEPAALGYEGRNWNDLEVLDNLVFDCLSTAVLGMGKKPGQQLLYFRKQIAAGESIDALVAQKVSFFVHDLHRQAYPKDAGVYKNLVKALKTAITNVPRKIELLTVNLPPNAAEARFGVSEDSATFISAEELDQHVRVCKWWTAALPKVFKFSKGAVDMAVVAVEAMPEARKTPFRFGDLRQAVSKNAYEPAENIDYGVEAEFHEESGSAPSFVRTSEFHDRYQQERESFDLLIMQAHAALDRLPRRKAVREKMHAILDRFASEIREGRKATQAEIARQLKIAPQSLSDYMKLIRDVLDSLRSVDE